MPTSSQCRGKTSAQKKAVQNQNNGAKSTISKTPYTETVRVKIIEVREYIREYKTDVKNIK